MFCSIVIVEDRSCAMIGRTHLARLWEETAEGPWQREARLVSCKNPTPAAAVGSLATPDERRREAGALAVPAAERAATRRRHGQLAVDPMADPDDGVSLRSLAIALTGCSLGKEVRSDFCAR
jgi:hypothetical protein